LADEKNSSKNEGPLVTAAKAIGKAAGKVAAVAGAGGGGDTPKQKENVYKAEYLGSGTFVITKPKRKRPKLRQSRLKGAVRGARK
jgi:hypothetical protein